MKKMIKYAAFTLSVFSTVALANLHSVHSAKCDYIPTTKDTDVNFNSCQFNDDDVARVMKNIPDHSLYFIDLSNNNLSAISAKIIVDKMIPAGVTNNTGVLLGNNHIGNEGANILKNLSVAVLDVSNNYLSSQGIDDITHVSDLKILNIGNNHVQPVDVSKLLKIENIEYLYMERATFDENNINEMAQNKTIVGYSFADTNITPGQLYKVTNNKKFDILDLSGLHLTNDVFTTRRLYQSCDYLDLSNNPLLDFKGDLVEQLNINHSAQYSALILVNDNIADRDVSYILSGFSANGAGDIDLTGTQVTNQLSDIIAQTKTAVRYLVIDNAKIDVDGLQKLLNNKYVGEVEVENKLMYQSHQSLAPKMNDNLSSHRYHMYHIQSNIRCH